MTDDFEDHCWKDVVTPDVLEVYSCYRRKIFVGPRPALLAVDLYDVVYRGGARPPAELAKTHPNSCGEYAHAAIEPTKRCNDRRHRGPDHCCFERCEKHPQKDARCNNPAPATRENYMRPLYNCGFGLGPV